MRKAIAAGVMIATAFAIVIFVPIAYLNDFSEPPGFKCSNGNQIISLCALNRGQGYASIAYWLFGTGGLYDSTMNRYWFVY